jgi:hypothetical protein
MTRTEKDKRFAELSPQYCKAASDGDWAFAQQIAIEVQALDDSPTDGEPNV